MLNDVTLENFGLTQNVSKVFALNFGTIIVLGGGFLPQHLLQRVSMKTVRMRWVHSRIICSTCCCCSCSALFVEKHCWKLFYLSIYCNEFPRKGWEDVANVVVFYLVATELPRQGWEEEEEEWKMCPHVAAPHSLALLSSRSHQSTNWTCWVRDLLDCKPVYSVQCLKLTFCVCGQLFWNIISRTFLTLKFTLRGLG